MNAPSLPRRALLLALSAAAGGLASAATPSAFNIRDYGARGDGVALDSPAINGTIEAAAASGGGVVVFPAGTYLWASIRLRSHILLRLEPGATIVAADPKFAAYDAAEPNEWDSVHHYQDFGHSHWHNSLIWGAGLEDIGIVGPGLIYGKGLSNGFNRFADESKGEKRYQDAGPGSANKAIALRECRNVVLRDFSILHGGHFGILATGAVNLTIDNLKIDTNRDGMDIDACQNVRVTNCSVNSPWDDGICLKASFALGRAAACENVTISGCFVTGNIDEGSLLDGTLRRSRPEYRSYQTGRIKLGTESNGDYRNIAISNCVFDDCRGLAIESVDGSHIEDVAISNLTMRHIANAPIFIRLGSRLRGPAGTQVGSIRRVTISNVVVSDADGSLGCVISGLPGHPVEDLRITGLRLEQQGGGSADLTHRVPPEEADKYPEPSMFGTMPSYAIFLRHVAGFDLSDSKVGFAAPEARPAFVLADVSDASFARVRAQTGAAGGAVFLLRGVRHLDVRNCSGIPDSRIAQAQDEKILGGAGW